MTENRGFAAGTPLLSTRFWITGGRNFNYSSEQKTRSTEFIDFQERTNSWQSTAGNYAVFKSVR